MSDPRYDGAFRTYSAQYLPENDWRLLKAQCWQESRFDPAAVSPVGAGGLCQFMPATWDEVAQRAGIRGSRFNPVHSIRAAAWYMRKLKRTWRAERPDEPDRNNLALASYNAGAGHLIKAQALCGGRALYLEIAACLPAVTGRHATETLTYVDRIRRWFALLVGGVRG